ncbi:MAG TPA: hypothetical protein VF552_05345 [Allosphingosinicella sp.]|jgi:hypothetical protein
MADNVSPSLEPPKDADGSVAGWTQLVAAVAAMETPATLAQLQACYGTPNGVEFGNPGTLIGGLASDPTILQGEAPAGIYPHIVWFVTRSEQAATTFGQTLGQLPEVLNPMNCGTPDQCGALAGQIMTGSGGLTETANAIVADAGPLVQRLSTLVHGVAGPLRDFNSAAADLSSAAAAAAAAGPTDLPPLQAAAAAAAARVRSALELLDPEVAGLNVAAVVEALVDAVKGMTATWQQVSDGLTAIVADTAPAQLGSPAYCRSTLHLDEAVADWNAFAEALTGFISNSLVSQHTAVP